MNENKKSMTPAELAEYFRNTISTKTKEKVKNKFLIYARKSTDEEGKQIRSIDDQIDECIEFAKKNDIKITQKNIITEKCSAKESGKRPEFNRMLKLINKGEYDSILAWHPDRLSRNMKESGEIIDLLDKNIIEDLKFVSFTYNNDPSGKLLLGITFALSKEYSDKLAVNVIRGNNSRLKDGTYVNKSKLGYYKDDDNRMRPNAANFELIKDIFKMRQKGETLEVISDYINSKRQQSAQKSVSQKALPAFNKRVVSKLLSDPIYAGVAVYGKEVYNFFDIYNFEPVISPDEYMEMNKDSPDIRVKRIRDLIKKNGIKADLLRGVVICSFCNKPRTSAITAKLVKSNHKTINYYNYRCDTKHCKMFGKSTRANVVIDYAAEYIKQNFKFSEDVWIHYQEEMKRQVKISQANLSVDKKRLISEKTAITERLEKVKLEIPGLEENSPLKKSFIGDFNLYSEKLSEIEKEIQNIEEAIEKSKKILSRAELIELLQKLPDIISSNQEMRTLNELIRNIYLNFYINEKNVVKSTVNSPFDMLFETKVSDCAQERT